MSAAGGCGNDADALSTQRRGRHTGQLIAGSEIENPLGAGGDCAVDSLDPVDRIDEDTLRKFARTVRVETATGRPAADEFDGLGQCGVMEADFGVERIEGRREDGTATLLTLTLAGFLGFDLFTTLLHACQLSGRPGENDAATAVADGEDSRALRRHTLGKLGDDGGETLGIDARDRNHRLRGGAGDDAAATADQAGSSTDELCDGEEFTVVVALRGYGSRGQKALRVADDGSRRVTGYIQTLSGECTQRRKLREEDAGE